MPADLVVVVNSPGAALIGDNLEQIVAGVVGDMPRILIESPGYSQAVWNGISRAQRTLAETFARRTARGSTGSVNLLGLSIFQRYYRGDLEELRRLLGLCGISVNCALGCKSSLEEVRHLGDADLNVVLYPENGRETAEYLKETFGTPFISPGLPLGFEATESWLKQICAVLGKDPAPALLDSERARAAVYLHVSRVNSLTGLPKGVPFAVHGTCSQCLAYARYLVGHFGMTAECLSILNDPAGDPESYGAVLSLLRNFGMESALERDILDTRAEMVFADANILAQLKLRSRPFCGVEISLPSFGYVDVIPKAHLGIRGALLICEEVLNGLLF